MEGLDCSLFFLFFLLTHGDWHLHFGNWVSLLISRFRFWFWFSRFGFFFRFCSVVFFILPCVTLRSHFRDYCRAPRSAFFFILAICCVLFALIFGGFVCTVLSGTDNGFVHEDLRFHEQLRSYEVMRYEATKLRYLR